MKRLDEFRFARWVKSVNRTAQVVLVILLTAIVNYLAATYFQRIDLTENRQYTLSPETRAYIRQLDQPVEILVTKPSENARPEAAIIYQHIARLLDNYDYESRREGGRGNIKIRHLNIFQQSDQAERLVRDFGINPGQENAIVVASGPNYREILGTELYQVGRDGVNYFRGEQAFTSAILDVTRPEHEKIYFVTGHGEMRLDDVDPMRGLSQAAQFLTQRGYVMDTLNLMQSARVPEDAGLVVLAGPTTRLLPVEVRKLREYLSEDNGRMLIFLEPTRDHGLNELLWDWGIQSDDMVVLEPSADFVAAEGDMIIGRFGEHPVTQFLLDNNLKVLLGLSRPVRPDPGAPLDGHLQVTPLLGSSADSWGERNYMQSPQEFNAGSDLAGPVAVATASERFTGADLGLNLGGGRIAVFGNATFIANHRFNALANRILFHNLLNWALDRDYMLNIPPRRIDEFQLALSRQDFNDLTLRMLGLPGAIAVLGIFVFLFRRY